MKSARSAAHPRSAFLKQILTLVPRTRWPPAVTINHYTSLETARKILSEQELRFVNARYSNDPNELEHGFNIIKEAIKLQTKVAKKKLLYKKLLKRINDRRKLDVCILCFCEDGDDLDLWRLYGSDGAGASIGMNARTLSKSGVYHEFGTVALKSIVYSEAKQRRIVKEMLRLGERLKDTADEAARIVSFSLFVVAALFKTPGYASERESRLLFIPSSAAKNLNKRQDFFTRGSFLIPYFSSKSLAEMDNSPFGLLQQQKLAIREVTLGPNANDLLNLVSFRKLLAKSALSRVPVLASKLKYRTSGK